MSSNVYDLYLPINNTELIRSHNKFAKYHNYAAYTTYRYAITTLGCANIQILYVSFTHHVEFLRVSTKKKKSLAVDTALARPPSAALSALGPRNTFSAQHWRSGSGLVARRDICDTSTVVMGESGDLSACTSSSLRKLIDWSTEL